MADVFISYAREDRARAEQIARGLEGQGLEVFWDSEIPPGQTWADYIQSKLSVCKAVIVLWSENSTKSQWVREEARMGRDRGTLIPVMIDATPAPFGFGEVQAANLSAWNGEADNSDWRRFVDAVRTISNNPTPRPAPQAQPQAAPRPQAQQWAPSQPAASEKKKGVPVWAWVVGSIVLVLVALGVLGSMIPDQTQQQTAAVGPSQQIQPVMPNETQPVAPAQSPQMTQQQYQDQIMQRLAQVEQAFASQGYQRVSDPVSGQLPQGQMQDWPVTLGVVGADYRIIGVCDQDCGDLDLELYDGYGNIIMRDNSADANPVVSVIPSTAGQFTVRAHMYNCTVQPCFYALVLYGRM